MLRGRSVRGWQMHTAEIVGKPDFYFSKWRIAVFVDGCFWHACPKCFQAPQQNRQFWMEKILRNKRRDRSVTRALRRDGITIIRLWEHDIEERSARLSKILVTLRRRRPTQP
jgi:DNA mismatch endonuclease, patch repair protein